MAQQQTAQLSWARLDVDPTVDHADVLELALDTSLVHARAFQQRLVEAFEPAEEEQKPHVPHRLAILLGLTCALWIMVGITIMTVLYAWPQTA
ncbi:hypothetical protein [Novosphingobium sp. 9U]|uniref:hypothetical protein n=1 Tax=Novosphingobium sp. 9U TaxID=2653158 RepID=UPI0012F3AA8A|nr:hypothetical protein [Novosphingobium sp. 9U]VWX50743.1 hypothetical protein NOVOSPHI9U_310031 [Novosphingobium sp. 9U]